MGLQSLDANPNPKNERYRGIVRKFNSYKLNVLSRLIQDDDLMKLIKHTTSDALNLENVSEEERSDFLHKYMHVHRINPNVTENKTMVISVDVTAVEPPRFKDSHMDGFISVYLYCHRDLIRTDTGSRLDVALDRIDFQLNNMKVEENGHMGSMKLYSCVPLDIQMGQFIGYEVVYHFQDAR